MDFGAAVRASAISAARSAMRYWSRGAIFEYVVVVAAGFAGLAAVPLALSCAMTWCAIPSRTSSAKLLMAIRADFFFSIVFLLRMATANFSRFVAVGFA